MTKLPPRQQCLIVRLLGERERYGLDLVRASGGDLKRGGVYVTLGRMQDMGLVSSRQEEGTGPIACPVVPSSTGGQGKLYIGIPRRLYRLTERGLRVRAALELLADA